MENEARRRAQLLSSHNIEEFRAVLKEIANEPAPQPASYRMGGIVRAVFPQLCLLRKRGYSLKMLVGLFEENGLRITATALSGYMKKLDRETEGASAIEVHKPGTLQPPNFPGFCTSASGLMRSLEEMRPKSAGDQSRATWVCNCSSLDLKHTLSLDECQGSPPLP
jgi:hypothetical protein